MNEDDLRASWEAASEAGAPPPPLSRIRALRDRVSKMARGGRERWMSLLDTLGPLPEAIQERILDVAFGERARPAVSPPPPKHPVAIEVDAYDKECTRLKALLREIEDSPIVVGFPHRLDVYTQEDAICAAHETWANGCAACHGDGGRRGRGRPPKELRRRLLSSIMLVLRDAGWKRTDKRIGCVAAILKAVFDDAVTTGTLTRLWHRLDKMERADRKALDEFLNSIAPLSQVRELSERRSVILSSALCAVE